MNITIEQKKQKALEQLKKEGYFDEDIVKTLYLMYANDEMCLSDLRTLRNLWVMSLRKNLKLCPKKIKKQKDFKELVVAIA